MTNRINIIGAKPKKINVLDQPKRRIEPSVLAAALGVATISSQTGKGLDPIALWWVWRQQRSACHEE